MEGTSLKHSNGEVTQLQIRILCLQKNVHVWTHKLKHLILLVSIGQEHQWLIALVPHVCMIIKVEQWEEEGGGDPWLKNVSLPLCVQTWFKSKNSRKSRVDFTSAFLKCKSAITEYKQLHSVCAR